MNPSASPRAELTEKDLEVHKLSEQRWTRKEWPGMKLTEMKWPESAPASFMQIEVIDANGKTATDSSGNSTVDQQKDQSNVSSAGPQSTGKKGKAASASASVSSTKVSKENLDVSTAIKGKKGTAAAGATSGEESLSSARLAIADVSAPISVLNLPFVPLIFESRDAKYESYRARFEQQRVRSVQEIEQNAEIELIAKRKWDQQIGYLRQ